PGADVLSMADAVLDANGGDDTVGGAAFVGRGGFANVAELSNDQFGTGADQSFQTTDASQEEIIGKIAHLLTVRQNYFNVIVVAQAIKDVSGLSYDSNGDGTLDATASYGSYDWGYNASGEEWEVDPILAEQKIKAVVYRDAFRNTYEVKRYEFLED
ncbi:MAG: hypothetical protein ACOCWJ_05845, partial [Verrucomicrobiota bacterium]